MAVKDPVARKAYAKAHYEANKAVYKETAKRHKAQQKDAIRALIHGHLSMHPCIDCGEPDQVVLEFDHRDDEYKSFNIGDVHAKGYSLRRVAEEIAKCDVRCANCHRRRTAVQQGWYTSSPISAANDNVPRIACHAA